MRPYPHSAQNRRNAFALERIILVTVGGLVRILLFLSAALCGALAFGQTAPKSPMSLDDRLDWTVGNTIGLSNLAVGTVSSAWGTKRNAPEEYGPHWDGFGKRYGLRLTGTATSNIMEAGLGAVWGEDPRYVRTGRESGTHDRILGAIKQTFMARDRNGRPVPAYARYAAISGSNFVSNTWRPDSEATVQDAVVRTGFGFLGRMAGNAFEEFWPDIRRRIFGGRGRE